MLPFRGWTTPGVFTLGGAQIALKSQGCAIGEQVVFLGSGPLLYLVAWQYVKAGAQVAAVLDTAPFSAKLHLLRGLLSQPAVVMRGLRYAAELMARGVAGRISASNRIGSRVRHRSRALSGMSEERNIVLPAMPWDTAFPCAQKRSWRILQGAVSSSTDGTMHGGLNATWRGAPACRVSISQATGPALPAPTPPSSRVSGRAWPSSRMQAGPSTRADRGAGTQACRDPTVPRRSRSRLPLPARLGQQRYRRCFPLSLRGDLRRPGACRRARSGSARTQSPQGLDPHRHGPLPGTDVRKRGGGDPGSRVRSAAGDCRPIARAATHQAHPSRGHVGWSGTA